MKRRKKMGFRQFVAHNMKIEEEKNSKRKGVRASKTLGLRQSGSGSGPSGEFEQCFVRVKSCVFIRVYCFGFTAAPPSLTLFCLFLSFSGHGSDLKVLLRPCHRSVASHFLSLHRDPEFLEKWYDLLSL